MFDQIGMKIRLKMRDGSFKEGIIEDPTGWTLSMGSVVVFLNGGLDRFTVHVSRLWF